jgi:hypothetical protein
MANRVCWSCGTLTHMTVVEHSGRMKPVKAGAGTRYRKQAAFTCDQCHVMSIGQGTSGNVYALAKDIERWLDDNNVQIWLPERSSRKEFPDVPEHIASAASETTLCLSMGAYRAAGSLARAVVEAVAKEKGIVSGQLHAKIEALQAAHHIRPHTRDQAHEVRHFGNGMAHGDFTDPVTSEEAEEIVLLMSEILEEVYQSPARLARLQAARQAKKAAASAPPSTGSTP